MMANTWTEGWEKQLRAALQRLGYGELSELLHAHPAKPYGVLAAMLAGPDFRPAPMQVISLQYEEARRRRDPRGAAMDALCRVINEKFPAGWDSTVSRADRAVALTGWASEGVVSGGLSRFAGEFDAVFDYLFDTPPASGWLPASAEDPYIRRAFDHGWPVVSQNSNDG